MVTPAADVSARVTLIPLSNVIFVQIGKERDRLTFNLEPRSSDSFFFFLPPEDGRKKQLNPLSLDQKNGWLE